MKYRLIGTFNGVATVLYIAPNSVPNKRKGWSQLCIQWVYIHDRSLAPDEYTCEMSLPQALKYADWFLSHASDDCVTLTSINIEVVR